MRKIVIAIIKTFAILVLILIISLFVLLAATPLVNDHVARKTLKELTDLPLPDDTEYIESVWKAAKIIGNGNGMQYLGAMLIRSELSEEELRDYYSDFAEHEWECVVEKQVGTDIIISQYTGLSFQTDVEGDNYYIVYSWGHTDTIFYYLDIRGH